MNGTPFEVAVDHNVVRVAGELDLWSAPQLDAALRDAERSRVVVDLARTTFIDAHSANVILRAADQARAEGHAFEVHNATGVVRRVFQLIDREDVLVDDDATAPDS